MKTLKKEELITIVEEMEEVLCYLENKITKQKKITAGRKEQVLEVLKTGPITVGAIAKRVGITNRNASSQLCYLKKDGYVWYKDQLDRLILQK